MRRPVPVGWREVEIKGRTTQVLYRPTRSGGMEVAVTFPGGVTPGVPEAVARGRGHGLGGAPPGTGPGQFAAPGLTLEQRLARTAVSERGETLADVRRRELTRLEEVRRRDVLRTTQESAGSPAPSASVPVRVGGATPRSGGRPTYRVILIPPQTLAALREYYSTSSPEPVRFEEAIRAAAYALYSTHFSPFGPYPNAVSYAPGQFPDSWVAPPASQLPVTTSTLAALLTALHGPSAQGIQETSFPNALQALGWEPYATLPYSAERVYRPKSRGPPAGPKVRQSTLMPSGSIPPILRRHTPEGA